MDDPLGTLIDMLRADTGVRAIVGADKISALSRTPPAIRIRDMGSSARPFGRGSGRLGVQLALYALQCYGPSKGVDGQPVDTGPITARQLAGAVVAALDHRGPYAGSTYVLRAYAPEIGPALVDPDERWPYHTVRVELYANQ